MASSAHQILFRNTSLALVSHGPSYVDFFWRWFGNIANGWLRYLQPLQTRLSWDRRLRLTLLLYKRYRLFFVRYINILHYCQSSSNGRFVSQMTRNSMCMTSQFQKLRSMLYIYHVWILSGAYITNFTPSVSVQWNSKSDSSFCVQITSSLYSFVSIKTNWFYVRPAKYSKTPGIWFLLKNAPVAGCLCSFIDREGSWSQL